MQIVVTETNMTDLKQLQEEDSIKDIEIAKLFHDTYEKLAPEYGYKTREDTKEFDPFSPNGRLMIEVCRLVGNKSHTLGIQKGIEMVEGVVPEETEILSSELIEYNKRQVHIDHGYNSFRKDILSNIDKLKQELK